MPRQASGGGHRVRDIAEQAGVSEATVDRVLHARPGVSARAVRQVEQAILDLDRQATQLRLGARTVMLDVVMQAPARFTAAVRTALEGQLPGLRPATVRARFHLREKGSAGELASVLADLGRRGRGSDGVLLKAPDDPAITEAIDRLVARGVPVVTLVTDVHGSGRIAYVGLDNASAGATAALLCHRWGSTGPVLVTLSRRDFLGERERHTSFLATLADLDPGRGVVEIGDADGLDASVRDQLTPILATVGDGLGALYSIGGGNRGIVEALAQTGLRPGVFVAHDLDQDNEVLLRTGVIDVVLDHDLRADMRCAVEQVLRHHDLLPGAPTDRLAPVAIITRHNIPPRLRG